MRIDESELPLDGWWATVVPDIERSRTLEAAAQAFADDFYAEFVDSTVLVRVFATVPLGELDASRLAASAEFTACAGHPPLADGATPVLALLGTRGVEPAWNVPGRSREHRAIPLVSADFVAEIPMIARLLAEVGFAPLKSDRASSQYVKRAPDAANGLFFVGDARTTTDERGRLIIPAVDFVERYGIKTVFGFGGFYPGRATFLTTIVFCRHAVMRPDAARFVPLVERLKADTSELLERKAIFGPG